MMNKFMLILGFMAAVFAGGLLWVASDPWIRSDSLLSSGSDSSVEPRGSKGINGFLGAANQSSESKTRYEALSPEALIVSEERGRVGKEQNLNVSSGETGSVGGRKGALREIRELSQTNDSAMRKTVAKKEALGSTSGRKAMSFRASNKTSVDVVGGEIVEIETSLVPEVKNDDPGVAPLPIKSDEPVFYMWRSLDSSAVANAALLSQKESAATVLDKVRKAWSGLPPEKRCIMIAPLAIYQDPPFKNYTLEELVIHGPDLSESQRWWSGVLWSLSQNELVPHRVAIDWETGMDYWSKIGSRSPEEAEAIFQTIWENPQAFSMLPKAIAQYQPSEIHWQRNRLAAVAWSQYGQVMRRDALREAYVDPLLKIFPDTKISNYKDALYVGEMVDRNRWPYAQSTLAGESSPNLYRDNAEDNLAMLRAIIAADGPLPVPWISHPSYIGYDAWSETVKGAYALGVREFLVWNANRTNTPAAAAVTVNDEAFMEKVIRLLGVGDTQGDVGFD